MHLVKVVEVVDGLSDKPIIVVIKANKRDMLQCRVAKVVLEPGRDRRHRYRSGQLFWKAINASTNRRKTDRRGTNIGGSSREDM